MADTLFPAAGQLLGQATSSVIDNNRTELATREQLDKPGNDARNIALQGDESRKLSTQNATESLQQKFVEAKLSAQADKEKYMRESVEVPPEVFQGMADESGVEGFRTLAEKSKTEPIRMPAKELMSVYTVGMKKKFSRPYLTDIIGPDGKATKVNVQMTEDDKGNWVPTITPLGGSIPKPAGKGSGKNTSSDWFKKASDMEKTLTGSLLKKGSIPKESVLQSWGIMKADPARQGKIAAMGQQYSDYQTAVENYNQTAEAEGKSPIHINPDIQEAMNTMLSLSKGDTGGDASVISYMKDNKIKDTPKNREWAKKKLNG